MCLSARHVRQLIGQEPNPGLRAVYQQHLKEAMARIKEEHPDWKPLEVLTEARAQFAPYDK